MTRRYSPLARISPRLAALESGITARFRHCFEAFPARYWSLKMHLTPLTDMARLESTRHIAHEYSSAAAHDMPAPLPARAFKSAGQRFHGLVGHACLDRHYRLDVIVMPLASKRLAARPRTTRQSFESRKMPTPTPAISRLIIDSIQEACRRRFRQVSVFSSRLVSIFVPA